MSIVKDMSLAPSGRQKIQWVRDFMPALSGIEDRFRREKPFAGLTIAVSVHLEAKKLGLKGIPREQLPRVRQLLPKIYLLAPLVLLVVMVSTNMYTMAFSAAIAIVAAVAVGLVNNVVEIASKSSNREDFLTFGKIIDALEGGAKGSITVAVACGVAGIISGCITVTGLASKLASSPAW